MHSKCFKTYILAVLLAGLGGTIVNAGYILRVFYDKIPGTNVTDLVNAKGTNSAGQVYNVFPNGPNVDGSPLQSEIESPWLEAPSLTPPGKASGPSNFGAMMRGFIQAPQTGSNYVFWVAADDSAELWLSTDANPANAKKIASCTSSVSFRSWTSQTTQQSSPISLVRGQQYYVEVRQKQGTGSEFVSVGWQLPDGTRQRPIPTLYVQPYPLVFDNINVDPSIVQQPVSLTVTEHQSATFFVTVNASEPVTFQWYRGPDQNTALPISDAILGAYIIPSVQVSDNGATFRVLMTAKTGVLLSQVATLTVVPDVTPPTVTSASVSYATPTQVTLNFSEPVNPATATDVANYSINNGVMILGAMMANTNNTSVTLLTSQLSPGVTYTATVNGIKDLAATPNTIAANSTVTFSYFLPIEIGFIDNVSGTSTNDIKNNTKWKSGNYYDRVIFNTSLETPGTEFGDNYIGQMRAYVVPPVDGAYTFYIASDDAGMLFLSTDDNPANKVMIAGYDGWTNQREYINTSRSPAITAFQHSNPITLKAGQKYYIEGDWKEGGGGDHMSVAWVKPGDPAIANGAAAIPGKYLLPYGYSAGPITISGHFPVSQTVNEGQPATFTFPANILSGTPPYYIQWYKNGSPLPGATGSSVSLPPVFQADDGTVLTVVVSNNFSVAVSPNAVLTVNLVAPTFVAGALFTNTVNVTFNIPPDPASATNVANYSLKTLSGVNLPIQAAYLVTDRTVNLTVPGLPTADLVSGSEYKEVAGRVVVEAEHFATRAANGSDKHHWAVIPDEIGQPDSPAGPIFSNPRGKYIESLPDSAGGGQNNNKTNQVGTAPYIDYKVLISTPGSYRLWLRWNGYDGSSDSMYAQILELMTPNGPGPNWYRYIGNTSTYGDFNGSWTGSGAPSTDAANAVGGGGGEIPAVYTINTPGIYTIRLSMREDGSAVDTIMLQLASLPDPTDPGPPESDTAPSTLAANILTVSGVKDQSVPGVAMTPQSYPFVAVNAPTVRINNTQPYGVDPTKNTITAGGADIWGTADQFVLTAQRVSGNFDAIVRVESLIQADTWSKVGIMAREYLDPYLGTSRHVFALATADTSRSPAGQNIYNFQYRNSIGGSSSNTGSGSPPVQYPNTWIRLARVGNTFYAYYSYDAINWTFFSPSGGLDTSTFSGGAFPDTLYLGIAVTSHSTSATATAQISAFGGLPPIPVNFNFTAPPASVTAMQNNTATFTFSGSGPNGPYSYQWQKNGVNIPGATGTSYTTPSLGLADNGATFRVIISNSTSSQTSPAATLTVTPDTTPPAITGAGAFLGGKLIAVQWSKPLDVSTATNPSNYAISGGYRGAITGVSYRPSFKTVLALNLPIGTNAITVGAAGIKDLAGNVANASANVAIVTLSDADVGTLDLNVLQVGDAITPSSTNSPAAERSPNVLDSNPATKYLNFDKLNAGFTVTPKLGPTVITGIQLTTANDAPERDPASFMIEGSNDGTTFSTIATGLVTHVATRLTKLPAITFTNTTSYATYRVTFPTVFNAGTANSMQVADVALLSNGSVLTGKFSDPVEPGFGLPTSQSDFEVQAGGSDIWNNADGFHFVYQSVTGDFDVKVRVESLRYVSDNWAKAGLMVREDLSGGSRDVNIVVDPTKGANVWEFNYRNLTNGPSAALATAVGPVTYPNAWIRIQRQGNALRLMRSTNGTAWITATNWTPTNPYPASVYVGMCTTAHNNTPGTNTVAQYRDFSLGPLVAPKIIAVVGDPSLTKATVTFNTQLDPAAAATKANYTISAGLTVSAAVLDASGTMVSLTTSPQTPNVLYTVTAKNIPSAAGIPMAAVGTSGSFSAWTVAPGFLYREVWNGIGAPLSNLKASPRYPNAPDSVGFLVSFEAPSNVGSNYSQRVSGWLTPATSGNYTFFIAANQQAELYLSPDQSPANKTLIASVVNGTGSRVWNKEANQKSPAVALQAGVSYYVEALQAAGAANDNLAVTWTTDGSTPANGAAPISSTYISTRGNPDVAFLTITAQPQSVSTIKSQPASFTVAALAQQPIFYQWQEILPGGTTWVPIAGATGSTYSIAHTAVSDSGTQFRVLVSVPGQQLISSTATLTVINDTTAPILLSATAVANSTQVTLLFTKLMDPTLANDRLSYTIFGGYNVVSAALQPDGMTVILTVAPPLAESQVVWAFGVTDLAGNSVQNPLVPITLVSAAPPVASVTTAAPTLTIERSGGQIILSWPVVPGAEYGLQTASPDEGWTPVTESAVTQGNQNTVTLPIGTGMKLYRLSK